MANTATASKQSDNMECSPGWSHGTFCWNELMTRDVERAKRFAGLFRLTSPDYDGVPESWMSYLAVDDVDRRVDKAIKTGAKLMKPIFDVPGVGRIAILMEPGGAGVGWMTPAN
jgi:predicted enzyme related to lactoylglutathione lyase